MLGHVFLLDHLHRLQLLIPPELEAGLSEIHHELRHAPDGHPSNDGFRKLHSRVLKSCQTKLNPRLITGCVWPDGED